MKEVLQTLHEVIFLFVLGFVSISGGSVYAANPPLRHVLILNSYHHGYKGSDDLVQGIQDSLLDSKIPLEVKVEYLDSKHYSGVAHHQRVLENLKRIYAKHDYELLITTDGYAFDVVDKHRDSIFGKISVVFAETNYFDPSRGRSTPDFMGVDECATRAERPQRTGQPFEAMEVTLRCKDGSRSTVLADFAPILLSKNREAIVTLHDISERKHRELELQQAKDSQEHFNTAMVGREIYMIELKQKINALSRELGRQEPFPLGYLNEFGQVAK
jgi:hypothetical protein